MNFSAALSPRFKAVSPYAGTAGGLYAGGAGTIDYFKRDASPSPIALVRENLGTAYACSSLNADLVAKTRLRLYVKTRKGEGASRLKKFGKTKALSDDQWGRLQKNSSSTVSDAEDLEEVTDHPSLSLLERPNPRDSQNDGTGMSLFTLMEATQLYQETVGRVYWYCGQRNETKLAGRTIGSMPSQIWLLAPQYVTEWPGTGDDAPVIEYYQFALGTGKLSNYSPREVVPFRMTDMATGGYSGGMPPLRACFEQVRLARFADALTSARVQNGGRPDAIYTPTGDEFGSSIGRDEAARLQSILNTRFRMAGAGSVMVADIPGDIHTIQWPINEIMDAARYALTREQIAEAYHVPMTKLKRDSANRASAESGEFAHALDAGLPRCRRNEAALNNFYTPMFGAEAAERLFFAFDDPPGLVDQATIDAKFTLAVNRGAITINEQRKAVGAKEIGPQGDAYLVPSTVVALQPDGTPSAKAAPTPGGDGKPQTPEQEAQDAKHPIDPSGAVDAAGKPVKLPADKPAEPAPTKRRRPSLAKALNRLAKLLGGSAQAPVIHIHNGPVLKTEGPHSYACLMVPLPEPHASDLVAFGKMIPDEHLGEDGRENDPHVTVKYGLHDDDPKQIRSLMSGEKPITLTIGKCKVFPANDKRDSDVVVFDVDSPDLHRLNASASTLPHTDTYPDYKPHLTAAYVKPGLGHQYATMGNSMSGLVGRGMTVDRLSFADAPGNRSTIPLGIGTKSVPTTVIPDDPSRRAEPPKFAPPQPAAPGLEAAIKRFARMQRDAVLEAIDQLPDGELMSVNGNGHSTAVYR